MTLYDLAEQLAKEIKKCPEYLAYQRLKQQVFEDAAAKAMIEQYKRAQFEVEAEMMAGGQPNQQKLDALQKMGEALHFREDISEFFIAEYQFHEVVSKIYGIIGDACELSQLI